MSAPYETIRKRINLERKKTLQYLIDREITKKDLLIVIHAQDTSWHELPEKAIEYSSRISSLVKEFNQIGGIIYELKSDLSIGFEEFFKRLGLNVEINKTFQTDYYGWIPITGVDDLIKEIKQDNLPNGRILLVGSKLNENYSDIPSGCVGCAWEELAVERQLPAAILRDYCFQYGNSSFIFKIDDLVSLKPDKKYQGCI